MCQKILSYNGLMFYFQSHYMTPNEIHGSPVTSIRVRNRQQIVRFAFSVPSYDFYKVTSISYRHQCDKLYQER